jgi:hypothetical protein
VAVFEIVKLVGSDVTSEGADIATDILFAGVDDNDTVYSPYTEPPSVTVVSVEAVPSEFLKASDETEKVATSSLIANVIGAITKLL